MKKLYTLLFALGLFANSQLFAQLTVYAIGVTSATCGDSVTIQAIVVGGVANSYSWTPGGQTTQSIKVAPMITTEYVVLVMDLAGKTAVDTFKLTINPLSVNANDGATPCGDSTGTSTASTSGGTSPYTYAWSDGQLTATAADLKAGTYTVTITDKNGCTGTKGITISNFGGPGVSITPTDPKCKGSKDGEAEAFAQGANSPFSYLWSTTPPDNDSLATGLGAGTYTLTVTDQAGCKSINTVTLGEPTALIVMIQRTHETCASCCDGTANAFVGGGTSPYTYLWSPGGNTDRDTTALCTGTYTVTVTDKNGCTKTATTTVDPFLPTGISTNNNNVDVKVFPNPATESVTIQLNSLTGQKFNLVLFDQLGRVVKNQTLQQTSTLYREELKQGLYFYSVFSAEGNVINRGKLIFE